MLCAMARKADKPAGDTPSSRPAQLAEIAFDRKRHGDIEKELAELSPEEARIFLHLIEAALRKRKIMLFGYLLALVAILGGMMLSFWVYATREPGEFVGWVFMIPLASVGLILWLFGRWANRP
jgi:hypothetical protein